MRLKLYKEQRKLINIKKVSVYFQILVVIFFWLMTHEI